MAFFRKQSSGVERAAMALAAAGGVAHTAFFSLFVWRVIGREGFGTIGYVILAALSALGIGLNFIGFWLVRSSRGRRFGYMAIAISSVLAGILLAIASWTA